MSCYRKLLKYFYILIYVAVLEDVKNKCAFSVHAVYASCATRSTVASVMPGSCCNVNEVFTLSWGVN